MSRARSYHHGNLRAVLLDAAERSIEELGGDQLSLRELARTAGVSHAAPRGHFPDRQALLDALAERGFERLAAAMRAAAGESGPGFEARLRAIGAAYVAFASSSPALLELMYANKPRDNAEGLQAAMADVLSVVLGLVADGVASGVLAVGEPQRYALLLFAIIRGIAALVINGIVGPDTIDQLLDDAGTTFIRGSAP
jgi:AcrR family transcriptional regulator